MIQESVTVGRVHTQESYLENVKSLWSELNEVRNQYSDCGANESETDWKVQATLYAISFRVLVDVPKTQKRFGLVN